MRYQVQKNKQDGAAYDVVGPNKELYVFGETFTVASGICDGLNHGSFICGEIQEVVNSIKGEK